MFIICDNEQHKYHKRQKKIKLLKTRFYGKFVTKTYANVE